ncbi:MAG: FkbM family methyltransferase [Rhodospirillales bacterium]|jgi:FkbM family methyltransferase|nr:FkbM family methyltransferase [Rhodospirillales bacterium]
MTEQWTPPVTFEERLKEILVPPWLYIRYKAQKELLKGEAEVKLLPFLVDPSRNAVDAGANKGTYTYFLARLARHVHAFEPNPKMFKILRRSMAKNVTASPVALSNSSGTAELRIPRQSKGGFSNQGGSLSTAKISKNYKAFDVETRRLDELDLGDVGFIKIDVEGFEQEVIDGAVETIRRCRPTMLIELEERYTKVPIEAALRNILDLGYHGLYLERGILRPLDDFDPVAQHRTATRGYVFNFVFLPAGTASPLLVR